MKQALHKTLWLLLALLLSAQTARAAFDNLGAGARAPGMGDAVTGLADDGWAMFYNPAGLAQLQRPQFSASYAELYTGLSDGSNLGLSQFAYALPIKNGDKGTAAFAFQRFALSSLYDEQSLYFSYAHQAHAWDSGRKLYWGLNLKYLNHSFSPGAEAASACQNGSCNGFGADPVLSGTHSKSVPDADLGLMYRFPQRFQIGLFVEHMMQPNVGFSGADKLPFNVHTGVSYKSLWMDLTGELRYDMAANGTRTKELIAGAERYFPTLDYGQFGVRGSLGVGDQDWKQLTLGLSYRINKVQIDYGFVMPIGGIATTAGTQRVALTFHFGAPTPEDEITRELLGKLQQARNNQPYQYEFGQQPHDLNDPKFAPVRDLIAQGHFQLAQAKFLEITKDMKVEDSLIKLGQRLQAAAFYYPDLPSPSEKYEIQASSALKNFLFGKDRTAMLHESYAVNLEPGSDRIAKLTQKMEQMTQLKSERLSPDNPRNFVDELQFRVEQAHKVGNRDKERDMLADIHELEPGNLMASERLGSLYYLTGDYRRAIEAWQKALPQETNAVEQQSMEQYIRQANEKLGTKPAEEAAPAAGAAAGAAAAAAAPPGGQAVPDSIQAALQSAGIAPSESAQPVPAEAAPAAASAPAARAQTSTGDPRQVADLYQRGVEHYARGEYLQAMAMFMRILQIDPSNEQAQKALERIQERVPSTRAYFQGGQQ